VAALAAGVLVFQLTRDTTAADVARMGPEVPGSFHELGTLPVTGGSVTLYTVGRYRHGSSGPSRIRLGLDWRSGNFGTGSEGANTLKGITFMVTGMNQTWLVAGRVADTTVSAVEIRSGSRTRMVPVEGGLFAFADPNGPRWEPDGTVSH
jgi:hypothetical protein